MASEADRLKGEMKKQLSAFGVEYEFHDQGTPKDDKAAQKREKAAKALYEFPLPLRCCWLFPKIRMPGMRLSDDSYGECGS